MLNVDRPHNPFIPTIEPDWKASKTTFGGSHALFRLNDRNSQRLSPTSDGNQPLPLDINQESLRKDLSLREPSSRNSSRSSVASMSSNVASKAAPPIPKKPALLSNRQHGQESRISEQGKSTSSRPPSGGLRVFDNGPKTSLSPAQQRIKQQEIYGQQAPEFNGPPLPPRSTGAIVSNPNGLLDDDNEDASAIPSLQPMRRQQ